MPRLVPEWQGPAVLESLFEQLPEPYLLYDDKLTITGLNLAAERLFRRTADEMVGRRCRDVFHCLSCEPDCGIQLGLKQGHAVSNSIIRMHEENGQERIAVVRTAPFANANGRVGVVANQGHHRTVAAAAARSSPNPPDARNDEFRAPRSRQRGHHHSAGRRERNRQGPDRQDAALPEPAPGRAVHRHQLRGHSRKPCWKASCSATKRAPSPTRARRSAASSNWPTRARCSWTKSARFR